VPLRIGLRVGGAAFYFSLLSTFAIGWRELNVGTWITRIQRREYTLRATTRIVQRSYRAPLPHHPEV